MLRFNKFPTIVFFFLNFWGILCILFVLGHFFSREAWNGWFPVISSQGFVWFRITENIYLSINQSINQSIICRTYHDELPFETFFHLSRHRIESNRIEFGPHNKTMATTCTSSSRSPIPSEHITTTLSQFFFSFSSISMREDKPTFPSPIQLAQPLSLSARRMIVVRDPGR